MRIFGKMKNRLNITVDNVLMEEAKLYAAKHKTSLSQLVEEYFKTLTQGKKPHKKNIIELMARLPQPKGKPPEGDVHKLYHESRKKKYGF
jgi:hypothetical protein